MSVPVADTGGAPAAPEDRSPPVIGLVDRLADRSLVAGTPTVPGTTDLVSVAADGTRGNGPSGGATPIFPYARGTQAISSDGRWVAFASAADNLVPADTNETADMFLRDRQSGLTIRAPWLKGAQLPQGLAAAEPTISADGGVVAFSVAQSSSTVGVAPTVRGPWVAVFDRATGTTSLASLDLEGRPTSGWQPSISGDGRFLAYAADIDEQFEIVVLDRRAVRTTLVSRDATGSPGSGASGCPSISADGRFVAFESQSSLLPGGADSNNQTDVYVYDRQLDTQRIVSLGPGGIQSNGASFNPSISGDGGVVAFASSATNLTTDRGLDGTSQVLVWERSGSAVRLVSVGLTGSAASGSSDVPSISASGRFVAFQSVAPDLVTGDTNAHADVFVRDIVRNVTIRASVDFAGQQTTADNGRPSISGDGGAVAFDSGAPAPTAPPANAGPAFTLLTSDATKVDTDLVNHQGCGDALGTGITASASDPDGVASLTLHFQGPGLATPTTRAMNRDGPNWYSFINPTEDGITASGTITWWVVALDTKGAATRSESHTIGVVRCDTPASIGSGVSEPATAAGYPTFSYCAGSMDRLVWAITASDPDNGSSPLDVVVAWRLRSVDSISVLAGEKGSVGAVHQGGSAYTATVPSSVTSTWYPDFNGYDILAWTITTTDRDGGRTSVSAQITVLIQSC